METDIRERARRRVQKKKKIITEIISFFSIASVLFFINIMTSNYMWCFWPIGFMAIGMLFSNVNNVKDLMMDDWEDNAVEREYKKLQSKTRIDHQEDFLDLEDLKNSKVTEKITKPRWDDKDFV